ncbi:MAG: exodeoxyribonuclease VII small subunit [Verrucomicrobiota bacterium]|nr:exodeoxyribonuclease VII small subunit [Verrucomicrobiota bacterium]
MSENSSPANFEESLSRLESLVESLESGDIRLSELVTKFEEGTQLLKLCSGYLKDAELKIEKLRETAGTVSFEPFVSDKDV